VSDILDPPFQLQRPEIPTPTGKGKGSNKIPHAGDYYDYDQFRSSPPYDGANKIHLRTGGEWTERPLRYNQLCDGGFEEDIYSGLMYYTCGTADNIWVAQFYSSAGLIDGFEVRGSLGIAGPYSTQREGPSAVDAIKAGIANRSFVLSYSYYFTEDVSVGDYYIDDGGNDMYNGGNELWIYSGGVNESVSVRYTQGCGVYSPAGLSDIVYYTCSMTVDDNSLFVAEFKSPGKNINGFGVDGNLGADGYGKVKFGCENITGNQMCWKKVYDAGDASVNHMIMIPVNGTWTQDVKVVEVENETYTDYDHHAVNGDEGVYSLIYVLFAGRAALGAGTAQAGAYRSDGYNYPIATFTNLFEAIDSYYVWEFTGQLNETCFSVTDATACYKQVAGYGSRRRSGHDGQMVVTQMVVMPKGDE